MTSRLNLTLFLACVLGLIAISRYDDAHPYRGGGINMTAEDCKHVQC